MCLLSVFYGLWLQVVAFISRHWFWLFPESDIRLKLLSKERLESYDYSMEMLLVRAEMKEAGAQSSEVFQSSAVVNFRSPSAKKEEPKDGLLLI